MANSIGIRVPLTQSEWRKLRRLSAQTGVPMGRLAADAIRAVHFDNDHHSKKAEAAA